MEISPLRPIRFEVASYHSSVKDYGFNFQWLLADEAALVRPPDEKALDFLVASGFHFVRLPMSYRAWTSGTDYAHPDPAVLVKIDRSIEACHARGLAVSINLHRAPGYCITRQELEVHNLWLDSVAQDAFVFLWESFARRYRHV